MAREQLPRTGMPVGVVALLGVSLLGGGVMLRRRIAEVNPVG